MKKLIFMMLSCYMLNVQTLQSSEKKNVLLPLRQNNFEAFKNINSYQQLLSKHATDEPNYLLALATINRVIDDTMCDIIIQILDNHSERKFKSNEKSYSPLSRSACNSFKKTSKLDTPSIQNLFHEIEAQVITKLLMNHKGQQASPLFLEQHKEIANEKLSFEDHCKKMVNKRQHINEQIKILLREQAKAARYQKIQPIIMTYL